MSSNIVSLVQFLLKKKNISISELSKSSGISRSTIINFLNEKSNISFEKFLNLCACLEIDMDQVISNELSNQADLGQNFTIKEAVFEGLKSLPAERSKIILDALLTELKINSGYEKNKTIKFLEKNIPKEKENTPWI